ncbi:MAG: LptA/OstA family protein, partial [Acidobacteriota bacterium]|nr:LptA/OstA family protein [Acidobacteriota bacterium]
MRRLKILRILLLALLVPFIVWIVITLQTPREIVSNLEDAGTGLKIKDVEFTEFAGGVPSLYLKAASGEQDPDGTYRVEDVQRLEVSRKDASPLVIKAGWGFVKGDAGARHGRLEGDVQVEDEDEELLLSVPIVEFSQVEGEARSLGIVTLDSPRYEGKASAVVYGLNGQPTLLVAPEIDAADGSTLRADRGRLLDGTRDVELTGNIEITRHETRLRAGRTRLRRTPDGALEQVELWEAVEGISLPSDAPFSSFEADEAEARWNEQGDPRFLRLDGDSFVQHGTSSLRAEHIEAQKEPAVSLISILPSIDTVAPELWAVHANGEVRASMLLGTGPAILISHDFAMLVDGSGNPVSGEAVGEVRFKSEDTSAEAHRATFNAASIDEQIVLHATSRRRARMARGKSRISAERIATNARGTRLEADGRVESSLLAGEGEAARGSTGLFRNDEAIHFVSEHLEGDPSTNALVFTGAVRGWQGDRNLSADRVAVDQAEDRLDAVGSVMTRLPRVEDVTRSSGDYIQVGSERLRYR